MKATVFTPTFMNKASKEGRGFITPPQHRQGGHPASGGGFSFGLIARMGDIQPKEVALAKEGRILRLHNSSISVLFFSRKEFLL